MDHERETRAHDDRSNPEEPVAEKYEAPEIVDYGTLAELTLSGSAPLTDSFMGAAGGS
jgi:hypothetical protein